MTWQADEPCAICGRTDQVTYHHIYTRKARKDLENETFNKMPLCRKHHFYAHDRGLNKLAVKYSNVRMWLRAMGWTFCPFLEKWQNERAFYRD